MASKITYTRCDCGNPDGHVGAVWHEGQPIPEGVVIVEPVSAAVETKPSEMSLGVAVIRCGCGNPNSHSNCPCPKPRTITDFGNVAYASSNPLKQAAWNLAGNRLANHRIRQEAEANLKETE